MKKRILLFLSCLLGMSIGATNNIVEPERKSVFQLFGGKADVVQDIDQKDMLQTGYDQYNARNYEKAIELFSIAIVRDKNNGRAYYFRGLSRKNKGDYPLALGDFEMAKRLGFREEDTDKMIEMTRMALDNEISEGNK